MKNHPVKFIQFDSFIIKMDEIIYAKKTDLNIKLLVRCEDEEKEFVMKYESEWARDEAFSKLTIDLDAWSLEFQWKHPLIKQIIYIREIIRESKNEFSTIRKELKMLRQELRKNRLNIKEVE